MSQRINLPAGTALVLGGVVVELPAETEVVFTGAQTRDQLAEQLSMAPTAYAQLRDSLTHTSERTDEEGNTIPVEVSYGVSGVRIERVLEAEEIADAADVVEPSEVSEVAPPAE